MPDAQGREQPGGREQANSEDLLSHDLDGRVANGDRDVVVVVVVVDKVDFEDASVAEGFS